jgi:5'-nucleotidase
MSLKVLGRWKRMGASMSTRFTSIQTNLAKNHKHTFHDASPTSTSTEPKPPAIDRVVRDTQDQVSGNDTDPDADEDEDDGPMYDDSVPIRFDERQKEVIRKVVRKWWRLAGLKSVPNACDELAVREFQVNWTKAIAPRLEGRIREVGGGARVEVNRRCRRAR